MNCKKIKELILTDYIDNEMSDKERMYFNIHLARCPRCREFVDAVKNAVVKPFTNVKKIDPPKSIWIRVKESIMVEQQEKLGFITSISEKLKNVFYIPTLALAVSTIMALVIIATLTTTSRFSNEEALKTGREDQSEYSAYSIETPVGAVLNNDGGFGTLVEEYFL